VPDYTFSLIDLSHSHELLICAYEGVNGVTSASLNFVPSSFSLLHQVLRQLLVSSPIDSFLCRSGSTVSSSSIIFNRLRRLRRLQRLQSSAESPCAPSAYEYRMHICGSQWSQFPRSSSTSASASASACSSPRLFTIPAFSRRPVPRYTSLYVCHLPRIVVLPQYILVIPSRSPHKKPHEHRRIA
jgi:hypothetical protein